MQNGDLEYGVRRCGFITKHESTKAPRGDRKTGFSTGDRQHLFPVGDPGSAHAPGVIGGVGGMHRKFESEGFMVSGSGFWGQGSGLGFRGGIWVTRHGACPRRWRCWSSPNPADLVLDPGWCPSEGRDAATRQRASIPPSRPVGRYI